MTSVLGILRDLLREWGVFYGFLDILKSFMDIFGDLEVILRNFLTRCLEE